MSSCKMDFASHERKTQALAEPQNSGSVSAPRIFSFRSSENSGALPHLDHPALQGDGCAHNLARGSRCLHTWRSCTCCCSAASCTATHGS